MNRFSAEFPSFEQHKNPLTTGFLIKITLGQERVHVTLTVTEANQQPDPEPQADPVKPSVTIDQPLNGAVLTIGDELLADYACSSDSAMVECDGSVADGAAVDTSTVGWKTFSVHAMDADGDETTELVTYRVIFPFAYVGPTLENPGLNSPITAGDKVKIRFTMFGYHGGAVLHGWPRHQQVDCTTFAPIGSPTVRRIRTRGYNVATSQYKFVWVTKAEWAGTCRQFYVRLEDQMHHSATFTFIAQFAPAAQD